RSPLESCGVFRCASLMRLRSQLSVESAFAIHNRLKNRTGAKGGHYRASELHIQVSCSYGGKLKEGSIQNPPTGLRRCRPDRMGCSRRLASVPDLARLALPGFGELVSVTADRLRSGRCGYHAHVSTSTAKACMITRNMLA